MIVYGVYILYVHVSNWKLCSLSLRVWY